MKKVSLCTLFLASFLFFGQLSMAQRITFQKIYEKPLASQAFNITATKDGGYAFIGISDSSGSSQQITLTKISCAGEVEWVKKLGISSTINNVFPGIVDTKEGDLLIASNIGQFNAYRLSVARIGYDGVTKWQKLLNVSGNNFVQSVVQTKDGGFVLAGASGSYGTDVNNFWDDVYLMKLNDSGTVLWTKTYGNPGDYNEANAVKEDSFGNLILTGRYIVGGTFYAMILKTDINGDLKFMKGYGAPNHRTYAYDIIETKDKLGYVITGATTINKTFFNDYPDVFLLKTDTLGNLLWSKIYFSIVGSDGSDSGSSVVERENGGFGIGVPTFSFSTLTTGFVPNKNAVFVTDMNGDLDFAKIYNQGSSHYTALRKALDGGYIISNFTTLNNVTFAPLIIKTDENFISGCPEIDVTQFLGTQSDGWDVQNAPFSEKTGGSLIDVNFNIASSYENIIVKCEDVTPVEAIISNPPSACIGENVVFINSSTGSIISSNWNFGDGTASNEFGPTHIYTQSGTYTVSLTVSSGCDDANATSTITIGEPKIVSDSVTICNGDSVEFRGKVLKQTGIYTDTLAGAPCDSIFVLSLQVNEIQVLALDTAYCKGSEIIIGGFVVKEPGVYTDTLSGNPCPFIVNYTVTDSLCVCDIKFPNVFTPNGDARNDDFRYYSECTNSFSFYILKIYNRFGKAIFETENPLESWNGVINEVSSPSEVYVYVCEYQLAEPGSSKKLLKGDITLIR